MTVVPFCVQEMGDATEQEALAYEPESAPSSHVRVCCVHVCPNGTEDDWYASTLCPLGMVALFHVQERDCGGGVVVTVQEVYWYEGLPSNLPLSQVRVCATESHDAGEETVRVEKNREETPEESVMPSCEQEEGGGVTTEVSVLGGGGGRVPVSGFGFSLPACVAMNARVFGPTAPTCSRPCAAW